MIVTFVVKFPVAVVDFTFFALSVGKATTGNCLSFVSHLYHFTGLKTMLNFRLRQCLERQCLSKSLLFDLSYFHQLIFFFLSF